MLICRSTRQIDIELIKEIKTEVDKHYDSSVYNRILEQTQGIMPQHFVDIDFFFKDGVFRHKFVLELSSGNMFGELGILMNKPRSATIVAASNVYVAVMTAYDYKRILKDAELRRG